MPVAGAEALPPAHDAPAASQLSHITVMRVQPNFGVSLSGRGIEGRFVGLYDYWFEGDELDEPTVFRRPEDAEAIVRVLFADRPRPAAGEAARKPADIVALLGPY